MTPNIFASPPAVRAVVALVLIENSQAMLASWNDLRQHYLPTLLGTVRLANPVVPIPVLWLTTSPVGDDHSPSNSAPPRQFNQLPELKFSFSPDNRITSRIINRATELMLETAAQFHGGPVGLHLFIVAASPPIHGTWGVSIKMPSQIGQSEWRLLGHRMAQLGIHCHMILSASQDMSSMNELFLTNLELQGHTQLSPWFPTPPDYTFLLAGNSSGLPAVNKQLPDPISHIAPIDSPLIEPAEQQQILLATRPPVLRHQSFLQDVQSAAASAPPAPVQNASIPSLVTSLQKVHGLSRKKLYSTQPPRQPFVREEPVRTKYKSTPTPLSIPVGSQPIPEDSRPVGKTKVERGRRAERLPHIGDVSNSNSPGRRSPWNRVSSDVGSTPSSPTTSMSSHHTTSPTMPLYPELAGYPSPPTSSSSFSPTLISPAPIPETTFSAPIHDPSGGYFSISPSFQSPSTAIPVHSPWTPVSKSTDAASPSSARRHSQELAIGSHMQSLGAMCKYRVDGASTEFRPVIKNTQKVKDAGDVPFIFSPELEAATAAKLKAALQSTAPPPSSTATMSSFSAFTSGGFAAMEDAYALSQPPPPPPSLGYGNAMRQEDACLTTALAAMVNGHAPPLSNCGGNGDVEPHAQFSIGSTTSSSLQGWAG